MEPSGESDGPAVLAGYGYGLPISRLYARYFGGDLQVTACSNANTKFEHPDLDRVAGESCVQQVQDANVVLSTFCAIHADHLDGGLWHRCVPAPQSPRQCPGAAALTAVRHGQTVHCKQSVAAAEPHWCRISLPSLGVLHGCALVLCCVSGRASVPRRNFAAWSRCPAFFSMSSGQSCRCVLVQRGRCCRLSSAAVQCGSLLSI
jgi:hypothetical protein